MWRKRLTTPARVAAGMLYTIICNQWPDNVFEKELIVVFVAPSPPISDLIFHVRDYVAAYTPHAGHHRPAEMLGIITHDMSHFARLQPCSHGGRFADIQQAIRVSNDDCLEARFAYRQETPEGPVKPAEVLHDFDFATEFSEFACGSIFAVGVEAQLPARVDGLMKLGICQRALPVDRSVAPH